MHEEQNVGQLLNGRYRLADRLGEGGMSVVWDARDEVLGRAVAVKVLAGPFAADPAWRQRIRTEARATASLSHPNVAGVYDYGETAGGSPFVVMELLRGPTLAERLTAGPLSPAAAIRVCAEVAAGLAAAHAEGFVHHDVKPGNVVLTPGAAKLLDFGIVGVHGDPDGGLDDAGLVLGTPAYLAPERLVGDEAVPASDVYAFGMLLYRCLTGRLPWDGETTAQMLRSHVTVAPDPLPDLPGVPAQVRDLCMRCLVKAPAARPSAEEAAAVLAEAAGVSPRPNAEELHLVPAVPPRLTAAGAAARTDDTTAIGDATAPVDPVPVAPAEEEPATDAPAEEEPATDAPAEEEPATDAPAEEEPATDAPAEEERATGTVGDDAGERRRVLAGMAVVVAVAALLVTFALSRPTSEPQVTVGAARRVPAATGSPDTPATPDTPADAGQSAGAGGRSGGTSGGAGGSGGGAPVGTDAANGNGNPGHTGNTGRGQTTPVEGPPVRIGTPGGVVVAACAGDQVNVTGAEPAAGGSLVSLQAGPRNKSRVEFSLAGQRLRFEVRCSGGVPAAVRD
ncbi:protein kinase [Dactylosporangium sp. NPDC050588]|uniref:serine/threonine-protein kinase n=1 Tax=Dactylosporangium sp. NPDC050588 TaxID=3157211 RepID=UPI0033D6D84A